jgi:hypothetical protein
LAAGFAVTEPRPFVPDPDRPAELPLTEFQQTLADCVQRIGPVRVRNCARNAFNHLRRAWRLHPVDAEMSLFRAITAEEEAASALMLALKQQQYPGAEQLYPRSHVHKAAVWPVLQAIGRGMAVNTALMPNISIAREGDPRIVVSLDIGTAAALNEPLWATLDHPFNFTTRSDEGGAFAIQRWEKDLSAIALDKGFSNIRAHIDAQANVRNQILYASHEGIPGVEFADTLLINRCKRVSAILVVTIGILQTRERQSFAIQGLEALLRVLDRLKGEGYDFSQHDLPNDGAIVSLKDGDEEILKFELRER